MFYYSKPIKSAHSLENANVTSQQQQKLKQATPALILAYIQKLDPYINPSQYLAASQFQACLTWETKAKPRLFRPNSWFNLNHDRVLTWT